MLMVAYIGRRLALALLTVWAISMITFVITTLPEGDVITEYRDYLIMMHLPISEEHEAYLRSSYGLDKPLHQQYLRWAGKLLQRQWGYSYLLQTPVIDLIVDRLIFTLAVSLATIVFTWVLAIPIGIYSAVRRHSVGDYTFTFLGFAGLAVPDFLLALVLMYIAFAYFNQSVGGLFSQEYLSAPWSLARLWDLLKHLWIPAIVLGTSGTAYLIRIMRNNLLDELTKPYVVTARAKGLKGWKVVLKYPVRLALNPLISIVGYLLPRLISGTIIVSVVLSLPTLGPLLLRSLLTQDTQTSGLIILSLGALTVLGTFISDVLLVLVDPRIKLTEAERA